MTVQQLLDSLSLVSDKSLEIKLEITDLDALNIAGWICDFDSSHPSNGNWQIALVLTGEAEGYLTGTKLRETMDRRLGDSIVRPECARCRSESRKLALVNNNQGPALCGQCANEEEAL